jgi:Periplasmic copper-binding protein (NosD)
MFNRSVIASRAVPCVLLTATPGHANVWYVSGEGTSTICTATAPRLDRGIDSQAATAVHIEDCVISNFKGQGIFDHRSGGQTRLCVKDTIVSDNGSAGVVAASAAVGITVLDNVTSQQNAYGIAVGTGNNVEIRNSVVSGNSTAGVEVDAGSHVVVRNSTISHNNIGVQSASSVRIFNNDISFNNTALRLRRHLGSQHVLQQCVDGLDAGRGPGRAG